MTKRLSLVAILIISLVATLGAVQLADDELTKETPAELGVKLGFNLTNFQNYEFGFTSSGVVSSAAPLPSVDLTPVAEVSQNGVTTLSVSPVSLYAYWNVTGRDNISLNLQLGSGLVNPTADGNEKRVIPLTVRWYSNGQDHVLTATGESPVGGAGNDSLIMKRNLSSEPLHEEGVVQLTVSASDTAGETGSFSLNEIALSGAYRTTMTIIVRTN